MSNITIEDIKKFIISEAERFGAKTEGDKASYILRYNVGADALNDNGAFLGFISPREESSGRYHDFSLVIFPSKDDHLPWLICLGVGSSGFKDDYDLSKRPGVRRLFSTIINHDGYYKSDFSDIESQLPKSFRSRADLVHLQNTIKTYSSLLPACQILQNPNSSDGRKAISAFVAAYAKLREWPTNNNHRKAIDGILSDYSYEERNLPDIELVDLIKNRKYLVLYGPPGTGKTRLAKKLCGLLSAKPFFVQFHAETSYASFVYGIEPDLEAGELQYRSNNGILTEAIEYALKNENTNVLLIIDEINRANLSHVLGPAFYLFEHKQDFSNVTYNLTPTLAVNKLPENFYVIGTMNTADRSLAIVDFALRRRFAWIPVKPEPIIADNFYIEPFSAMDTIFNWNANDLELNLQPGHSYFFADSDKEMKARIRYELYPLIKEYIDEGLLLSAAEDLNQFFLDHIGLSLFT